MTKRGKDETEIKDEEKGQNFMTETFSEKLIFTGQKLTSKIRNQEPDQR